jgi:uncharacterized membrane protein YjjP (DUF1212 family)
MSGTSRARLVGAGIAFLAMYLCSLLGLGVAWVVPLAVALAAAAFIFRAFPRGKRLGPAIFCVLVALIGAAVWVIAQDPFGPQGAR